MMATQLLVVPRSMPMILPMMMFSVMRMCCLVPSDGDFRARRIKPPLGAPRAAW